MIENGIADGLQAILEDLFGRIPIVGQVATVIDSILGFVNTHSIDFAFEAFKSALANWLSTLPPALPTLINPSVDTMVNLYGTDDTLYKLNLIGAKSDIDGFTPLGGRGPDGQITKQLFNIQIEGTNHSEYMRRDPNRVPRNADWNKTVAQFVTDLIQSSTSDERLTQFLNQKKADGIASIEGNVWVIKLNGWNDKK